MVDIQVKNGQGENKVVVTWESGSAECTGNCTGSNGFAIPKGEEVTVTAVADETQDWMFKYWLDTSDSPAYPDNESIYEFTITSLNEDKYFEAEFDQSGERTLTLQAASDPAGAGGKITAGRGSESELGGGGVRVPDTVTLAYKKDDSVDLLAEPDDGSYFVGWSGDVSGSTNPTTVSISDKNRSVTGTFAPKYVVSLKNTTASAAEGGDLVFPLDLDRTLEDTITVQYTIGAGSTNSAGTGDLTFGSGQSTIGPTDPLEIRVPTQNDTVVELDETFTLTLTGVSSGKALIGSTDTATGTITDNDPFTLSLSGNSQPEGTDVTFTVELGAGLELDSQVAVDYSVSDGTATVADSDYTGTSGTVYFNADAAAGSTQYFTVSTTSDAKVEADETIVGELSTGHSRFTATGATLTAEGTIANDDNAMVSISGDADATEGGATGNFTLTTSAVSDSDTTVTFDLDAASVAGSSDYSLADASGPVTTTVVLPAGSSSVALTVTASDDSLVEASEALVLKLVGTDNVSISTNTTAAAIDIDDNDDAIVSIDANDPSAAEPSDSAQFTVTLSNPSSAVTTVDYQVTGTATPGDTVTPGSDYEALSGSVGIPAGDVSAVIDVAVIDDSRVEIPETVIVTLDSLSGDPQITIDTANNQGSVTIGDDDSYLVYFAAADQSRSITEGDADHDVDFTISLDAAGDVPVTVSYSAAGLNDGSHVPAVPGSDFALNATSVTIPAGATSAPIPITIMGDVAVEEDDSFLITLDAVTSGPGTVDTANDQAVGTIINDDAYTLSINSVDVLEGDSGSTTASFTVSVDLIGALPVEVAYAVTGGSATGGGVDYAMSGGSVTIPANTAGEPITFTVYGDTDVEGNEEFTVTLGAVTGPGAAATDGSQIGTGTIKDDDGYRIVVADAGNVTEGDTASFTVSLVPSVGGAHSVSIDYATVDGSALAGSDYTAASGSLTFNNGNSSKTVDVATIGNTEDDGNRSFKLVLDETTMTGSFAGIAYVGDDEGTCTIVDDEYVVTFLVSSAGNGSISGTTPQVVSHGGSTSSVEALPIDGEHHFSGWTGDHTGDYSQNPLVISNVSSDMTVYANFVGNPVLTPSVLPFSAEDSAPHGEILPSTPQVVDYMSDFTFKIEPESGFCVDYVKVDNVHKGYHEEYTFTAVTADHTIAAHFRDEYQVRGAVSPETARSSSATWSVTGTHLDGTTFSAGPIPHFEPVSIPCDVLSVTVSFSDISGWETPAPQTITLTGDRIVTGNYKPQLTVTSVNGKVTSSDGSLDCGLGGSVCSAFYPYGTLITLQSTPDVSKVFSHWSGSIAGTSPTYSFHVKEPMSVTANYESETGTNVDLDGDGWTEDDGDCAPYDGTIYPGAPEVCSGTGSDVDHDCDGLTAASLPSDPDCDDAVEGISNLPLDTLLQAAPANIMVVVDDSGSMDWEVSCAEGEEGKYLSYYRHIFDDPNGDNVGSRILPNSRRPDWRTQWHDYNRMYYDPTMDYLPWPSETGDGSRMVHADPDCPKQDPMVDDPTYCLNMDDDYFSLGDATGDVDTNGIVVDSHDVNGGGFLLQWKDDETDPWTTVSASSPWPWRKVNWHSEGFDRNFYDTDDRDYLAWDYVQATWTPPTSVAVDQYYNVYAWWRDTGAYSENTKYYIYHEGGKAGPYEMNQENNGQTWNRLGDRAFRGITKVTIEDYINGRSDHVCADAVAFVPAPDPASSTLTTVPNAHYYVIVPQDSDNDGQPDLDSLGLPVPDRVILVVLDGFEQKIEYWEAGIDSGNNVTGFTALDPADPSQVPESIKPPQRKYIAYSNDPPTATEQYLAERQNFANWYSYYRRRELTAKAAIGELIDSMSGVRAGLHYINNTDRSLNVRPIRVTENDPVTGREINKNDIETLLGNLYLYQSYGGTRLRRAVKEVGEYFDQTDGLLHPNLETKDEYGLENPWASAAEGGECQQSFMIVTTDGYYNQWVEDIGNVDGQAPLEGFRWSTPDRNNRQLFADAYENTLADFTMKFYQKDLSDTLADKVPANDANHDYAAHQHLVSYTVALGLRGHLNTEDYVLYSEEPSLLAYPDWQDPLAFGRTANTPRKVDDLWHAAVNGRGIYLSAEDPAELTESLTEIMQNLVARIGSGSSVSINGEELHTGLIMYQARYSTDSWWGDVVAYPIDPLTGKVKEDEQVWSAAEQLGEDANWDDVSWDTDREIATYNPYESIIGSGTGIPFRWASITGSQQALLSDDPTTGTVEDDGYGELRLQYLRGSNANELRKGGTFRDRSKKLGDIVHSAPFYMDYVRYLDTNSDGIDEAVASGAVFVSANDGMLHAFDAEGGEELFAYVPNLVFNHLNMLSTAEPHFQHMYYVDMTPFIKEVGGMSGSEKLLVGGLGKGGKGYFCLDVTDPWNNSESNAADWVLWEYPQWDSTTAEKDNMGYSFSEAFIVQSYWTDSADATNHWVTIFGNGYASDSGTAALYVLNAKTGELLSMIDTGAVGNNGLSTPTPVDVNGDYTVDFVYAGDLQGNVWKFDLRDSDPDNWRSFYYLDNATPGIYTDDTPKPLFRARGREMDEFGNYTSILYNQPITTKVNVIKHCDGNAGGYMVLFGTGRYLSTIDLSNSDYQTMYGIWDYGDEPEEYLGWFSRGSTAELGNQPGTVSLLKQEVIQWFEYNNKWLRVLSDYQPDWTKSADGQPTNHAGWYLDLPLDKERVIRNSTVRDGKLIILSSIPSDDPCDAGGDSIVHEIDACTGGRLDSAQFDLNNDGVIDEYDLVPLLDASGNPMTDSDGNVIMVPPSGIKFDTMMYPPIILLTPGGMTERKYFSTAAGSIQTMEEAAERRGVYYWRMR